MILKIIKIILSTNKLFDKIWKTIFTNTEAKLLKNYEQILNKIIEFQNWIYISRKIWNKVLKLKHDFKNVKYFKITKIINQVTKTYYWSNMWENIHKYIRKYNICRFNKYKKYKSYEKLQSVKILKKI